MRKFLSILLICVFVLGGTLSVNAQTNVGEVNAQIRPDFTIVIDGKECGFKNVNNHYVYPMLHEDSTYLPLRAIAEIIGKKVNWDEAKKTITLSGNNITKLTAKSTDTSISTQKVQIQVRHDIAIVIDGKECIFKDANGKVISPVLYNGSTYLPLRCIGEIMGRTVTWDNTNKIVTLGSASLTVTDADSFNSTTNSTTTGAIQAPDKTSSTIESSSNKEDKIISRDEACNIVLKKVPGATVNHIKIELDHDDGETIYEGCISYDKMKYEFEIDASTGKILEWEIDD